MWSREEAIRGGRATTYLVTYYLLTTYYLLPTTYYLLLTTYYLLLTTCGAERRPLEEEGESLTTYYLLTYYLLLTTYLLTTYYLQREGYQWRRERERCLGGEVVGSSQSKSGEHERRIGPRAGEHERRIGPRAGEHTRHIGPRAGEHTRHIGFDQSLAPGRLR